MCIHMYICIYIGAAITLPCTKALFISSVTEHRNVKEYRKKAQIIAQV